MLMILENHRVGILRSSIMVVIDEESKDVFTTKQIEDMALLVSKQKNFNAMDSYNKACYLLQRECLERIAM
ncbi:hypothetical protein Bca101_039784 [Brassica carinata]